MQSRKSTAPLGRALLPFLTLLTACSTYQERIAPVPLASKTRPAVSVDGALISAEAFADAGPAEHAFGFDIRGAGLLPVGLVIDNRGGNVIRVNPGQTFLLDKLGQAWPLLTSNQAQNRVSESVVLGETTHDAGRLAFLGAAAGTLTGFAIGLVTEGTLSGALQPIPLAPALAGLGAGAATGASSDSPTLEDRIRSGLISHSLRDQRVQPGDLAHGYLFFPGRNEAQDGETLRLGLEIDGYPRTVGIPLQPPAKTPEPALQPRPTAR